MKTFLRVTLSFAVPVIGLCTAYSQATRTWVSGTGDDANPCSRTAPCKTFASAITKTAAGGEIDALDPNGSLGSVTITKAVTIDGGAGQITGVLPSATAGITISAGAGDVVTLRNLTLNGANQATSPGTIGVNILQAKAVHIENCAIFGFSTTGVNASTSAALELYIDRSFIRHNTGSGATIANNTTTGTVASVSETTLDGNGVGLLASGNSKVTVRNSTAIGNSAAGFQADATAGPATLNLLTSISANNGGAGLQVSSGGSSTAVIRISGVALFSNNSGLSIGANGSIFSYGDNEITGGGVPTATIPKQ